MCLPKQGCLKKNEKQKKQEKKHSFPICIPMLERLAGQPSIHTLYTKQKRCVSQNKSHQHGTAHFSACPLVI